MAAPKKAPKAPSKDVLKRRRKNAGGEKGPASAPANKDRKPEYNFAQVYGTNLVRERSELGLSREALALSSGYSEVGIGKIERDYVNVRINTAHALAQSLGLPLFLMAVDETVDGAGLIDLLKAAYAIPRGDRARMATLLSGLGGDRDIGPLLAQVSLAPDEAITKIRAVLKSYR